MSPKIGTTKESTMKVYHCSTLGEFLDLLCGIGFDSPMTPGIEECRYKFVAEMELIDRTPGILTPSPEVMRGIALLERDGELKLRKLK